MIIYHNPPPVWANVSQRFLTAIMRNIAHLPLIGLLSVFLNKGYTLGKISSLFKKDLEMIILRNNSYGGITRVCMGIFTTALRNKKISSNSQKKKSHLTSTAYCLLSDCLL